MDDYLPGTASLIPYVDKRLLVVLRDKRTLIGFLRCIDQFANLVLHRTIERIHVGTKYGDIPRGIFLVRGENVVLLGELDELKEKDGTLQEVPVEEILELQQIEIKKKQDEHERRLRILKERGLHLHSDQANDDFV